VVIESWRELSKHQELDATPVAYFAPRQRFIDINSADVDDLIELLRSGSSVDEVKVLASKICKQFETNPRHMFCDSEVLLSMGATWAQPMYFNAVAQVKRNGAVVVNLVYDLIPGFDNSFPYGTREPFQIYISEVARVSERVPCISIATRQDFEEFTEKFNLPCPPGGSTGLPGGFSQDVILKESFLSEQIPRKFNLQNYVLIVGTIESRKEHIVALKAWSELAKSHEIGELPDLVCVGRWGWNVRELIDEWNLNLEVKTKIHFLTENVTDSDLAYLYKNCLFTVYPSRMEGWGLPVTESLDFGKVVVTTNISSLPEAGEGLALLFESGNHKELASICENLIFDAAYRTQVERELAANRNPKTWETFAGSLVFEVLEAKRNKLTHHQIIPEFGREYGLMSMSDLAVSHSAKEYLAALKIRREMPFTSQVATLRHHAEA
jgi:glycosyltransferase involved in cell wall biosynthesis